MAAEIRTLMVAMSVSALALVTAAGLLYVAGANGAAAATAASGALVAALVERVRRQVPLGIVDGTS